MSFDRFSERLRNCWIQRPEHQLVLLQGAPSSHALGRRLVQEYQKEDATLPPVDLLAWQQDSGQGRQGREWASPAGGVYVTLIRQLDDLPLERLPLLVGVTLCDVLNEELAGRCRLRWPNDLMVEVKKIGGILLDVLGRAESRALTLSFGINHSTSPDSLTGHTATCFEQEGGQAELEPLIDLLVGRLDEALQNTERDWISSYRELSTLEIGQDLVCRLTEGELQGRFLGFDERGFLRLEVAGEERRLSAGEIAEDG